MLRSRTFTARSQLHTAPRTHTLSGKCPPSLRSALSTSWVSRSPGEARPHPPSPRLLVPMSSPKKQQDGGKGWSTTSILVVMALCFFCYILGAWQNGPKSDISQTLATTTSTSTADCVTNLNFDAQHAGGADADDSVHFESCGSEYSELTPCQDPIRAHKYPRDKLVYRERHCPADDERLHCLVPAPRGYRTPFPWPKSRQFAWFANVPHKELTVEKAIQNWIQYEGDRFRFPGGGTMFPRGAGAYIDDIAALIPLSDGSIRTALDTGCGVASWGAYLQERNILAMSFAPRDSHEAQVQFALERGVPAIIGIMSTERLPYPARAFDMAHCSRCLIPWSNYDGMYLIEVDRVLRPGGYWILSGPPINWKTHWKSWKRTEDDLRGEQEAIEDLARRLCWKKVAEKNNLAVWQKPWNHADCAKYHKRDILPRICQGENADLAWYRKMETCMTPLPEVQDRKDVAGGKLQKWPKRLTAVPPRIASGLLPSISADDYNADTQLWLERVSYYKKLVITPLATGRYRNIMDMNAGLGGFAAALGSDKVWVMNVVPYDAEDNTLGVIYERGLIGTYQNWCEAFSTYPRTYDLLHATSLLSMYQDRCNMSDVLLEMDRILRPEGAVLMRDNVDVLNKARKIMSGMRWESKLVDHENGPFVEEKILVAVKKYWVDEGERVSKNETSS